MALLSGRDCGDTDDASDSGRSLAIREYYRHRGVQGHILEEESSLDVREGGTDSHVSTARTADTSSSINSNTSKKDGEQTSSKPHMLHRQGTISSKLRKRNSFIVSSGVEANDDLSWLTDNI